MCSKLRFCVSSAISRLRLRGSSQFRRGQPSDEMQGAVSVGMVSKRARQRYYGDSLLRKKREGVRHPVSSYRPLRGGLVIRGMRLIARMPANTGETKE